MLISDCIKSRSYKYLLDIIELIIYEVISKFKQNHCYFKLHENLNFTNQMSYLILLPQNNNSNTGVEAIYFSHVVLNVELPDFKRYKFNDL